MIYTQLLERVQFDVPETWIKHELMTIKNDIYKSLASQNIDMEKMGFTEEQMNNNYRNLAEQQARRHLLLNYLIDQEKLVATDAEVDAEFERIAGVTGKSIEEIKTFYQHEDSRNALETLRYSILERTAFQMILDANTIETVVLEADDVSDSTDEKKE
jgi:trigger factor